MNSGNVAGPNGGSFSVSLGLMGGLRPTATAEGSAIAGAGFGGTPLGTALSEIDYSLSIVLQNGALPVPPANVIPVTVSAMANVSVTPGAGWVGGFAEAQTLISGPGVSISTGASVNPFYDGSEGDTDSISAVALSAPGAIINVEMYARGNATGGYFS